MGVLIDCYKHPVRHAKFRLDHQQRQHAAKPRGRSLYSAVETELVWSPYFLLFCPFLLFSCFRLLSEGITSSPQQLMSPRHRAIFTCHKNFKKITPWLSHQAKIRGAAIENRKR
jgi:hypothetical protein